MPRERYTIARNSPSSDKPRAKMGKLRRTRVLLEGDADAVARRFVPSTVRYMIFQLIALSVFAGAMYAFWQYWDERSSAQQEFQEVAQEYVAPVPEELPPVQEQDPDTSAYPPIIDFDALKAQNPDVVGWLRIPGTDVDYPVMSSPEKDFYLHKNINKEYSVSGSIFIDHECDPNIDADDHVLIYGHHMNFATMFHAVSQYKDREFFDSHRVIYLETPANVYVVKPVGTYVADAGEYQARQTMFNTEQDFQAYLDNRMARCDQIRYDDYDRSTVDRMVTLVTCTNSGNNRQVVECVVEQIYPTSMIQTVIDRALADKKAAEGQG